jgi:DNA-binding MarR family transcriptional regulator
VSPLRSEDDYNRQILEAIASGEQVTQRSLSGRLGVALGLTNLLIRRLVAKGYVRLARMGTRHVRYLMMPEGWEALARATRLSLENTVHLYTQTREEIRVSLSAVSARCPVDADGRKRIIFYGAGDVAEIAFVSLQSTDLTLVGVVDDQRTGRFFDVSILRPDQLAVDAIGGEPYGHVVVTSMRHAAAIRARLDARQIPPNRVSFLDSVGARVHAQRPAGWQEPLLDESPPVPRRKPRR